MDLSGFGAGQRQKTINHLAELIELFELAGQHPAVTLRRACLHQGDLGLAAQSRQRRAQFVGNAGGELPHLLHGVFQPGKGLVERVGQAVHFVTGSAQRQAHAQIGDSNLGRGIHQIPDRAQRPPRHPPATDRGQQHSHRNEPDQSVEEFLKSIGHGLARKPDLDEEVSLGSGMDDIAVEANRAVGRVNFQCFAAAWPCARMSSSDGLTPKETPVPEIAPVPRRWKHPGSGSSG